MKTEVTVKILELTHDELSNIITTAFYDNPNMAVDYEGTPSIIYNCFEDNVAQILLDGGTILVTDQAQDEGDVYGDLPKYVDNDGYITYKVTLEDILKRASNQECLRMIEDIESGEGDMFTAWNLMQIIVFGEIIYG